MGPQGIQGLTGQQGPQGPAGSYTAGSGIIINNNEISVNASGLPQSSQGTRIGYSSSSTWTCPIGVTTIKVEIWGGAGGGGGCFVKVPGPIYYQGGYGGSGGYNMAVLSVVPGSSYTITIGNGGNGGIGSQSPTSGSTGGTTSFGTLLTASGGGGGSTGFLSAPYFYNGGNATIQNYIYPSIPSSRSYIGSGYVQPNTSATGGNAGVQSTLNGGIGEGGFCVISY